MTCYLRHINHFIALKLAQLTFYKNIYPHNTSLITINYEKNRGEYIKSCNKGNHKPKWAIFLCRTSKFDSAIKVYPHIDYSQNGSRRHFTPKAHSSGAGNAGAKSQRGG